MKLNRKVSKNVFALLLVTGSVISNFIPVCASNTEINKKNESASPGPNYYRVGSHLDDKIVSKVITPKWNRWNIFNYMSPDWWRKWLNGFYEMSYTDDLYKWITESNYVEFGNVSLNQPSAQVYAHTLDVLSELCGEFLKKTSIEKLYIRNTVDYVSNFDVKKVEFYDNYPMNEGIELYEGKDEEGKEKSSKKLDYLSLHYDLAQKFKEMRRDCIYLYLSYNCGVTQKYHSKLVETVKLIKDYSQGIIDILKNNYNKKKPKPVSEKDLNKEDENRKIAEAELEEENKQVLNKKRKRNSSSTAVRHSLRSKNKNAKNNKNKKAYYDIDLSSDDSETKDSDSLLESKNLELKGRNLGKEDKKSLDDLFYWYEKEFSLKLDGIDKYIKNNLKKKNFE